MEKVIISAAITGAVHVPSLSPYLPITPLQIADEAVRAYEAGAAVAHIHVRNPDTGQPGSDLNLYREVVTSVKKRCNMVLCLTTGGALGMSIEERAKSLNFKTRARFTQFWFFEFWHFWNDRENKNLQV